MILKQIGFIFVILMVVNCSDKARMLTSDGFLDPFCAVFDQQTGDCVACICRGYFDKNRQCHTVSDLCQTWNINNGECTSCYRGYQLVNSTCIISAFYDSTDDQNTTIENPNCKTDNGNGTCLSCRPYYILYCNDCQTTGENPFCSKFDADSTCVECDFGYELDFNYICQKQGQGGNITDCMAFENCIECNQTQCIKCDEGYRQEYESKQCVLPTNNCTQGCALCSPNQCFTCQVGYSSQSWPPCINCSYMFARNSKGKCVAILSDCSSFPNCASCVVGQCRVCQSGYKLNQNQECVI